MKIISPAQQSCVKQFLKLVGINEEPESVDPKDVYIAALNYVAAKEKDEVKAEIKDLIDYLSSTNFFEAPASTKFHSSYMGGLAEHSINVAALFYSKVRMFKPNVSERSIIICGLLHDLCKHDVYSKKIKNEKRYYQGGSKHDAGGSFDWIPVEIFAFNDQFPCGHGSKSVILLQQHISLTNEEIMLILWHMGPFSTANSLDFNNACSSYPPCVLLYTADLEAAQLFETITQPGD